MMYRKERRTGVFTVRVTAEMPLPAADVFAVVMRLKQWPEMSTSLLSCDEVCVFDGSRDEQALGGAQTPTSLSKSTTPKSSLAPFSKESSGEAVDVSDSHVGSCASSTTATSVSAAAAAAAAAESSTTRKVGFHPVAKKRPPVNGGGGGVGGGGVAAGTRSSLSNSLSSSSPSATGLSSLMGAAGLARGAAVSFGAPVFPGLPTFDKHSLLHRIYHPAPRLQHLVFLSRVSPYNYRDLAMLQSWTRVAADNSFLCALRGVRCDSRLPPANHAVRAAVYHLGWWVQPLPSSISSSSSTSTSSSSSSTAQDETGGGVADATNEGGDSGDDDDSAASERARREATSGGCRVTFLMTVDAESVVLMTPDLLGEHSGLRRMMYRLRGAAAAVVRDKATAAKRGGGGGASPANDVVSPLFDYPALKASSATSTAAAGAAAAPNAKARQQLAAVADVSDEEASVIV
jgi:hypothetical protein